MDVDFIGLGRMGGAAARLYGVAGVHVLPSITRHRINQCKPRTNLICNGTSCFDGVEPLATFEPICALDFPLRVADQPGAAHGKFPPT